MYRPAIADNHKPALPWIANAVLLPYIRLGSYSLLWPMHSTGYNTTCCWIGKRIQTLVSHEFYHFLNPFLSHEQKGGGGGLCGVFASSVSESREQGCSVRVYRRKALAHKKCTPQYRTTHLIEDDFKAEHMEELSEMFGLEVLNNPGRLFLTSCR